VVSGVASVVLTDDVEECRDSDSVVGAVVSEEDVIVVSWVAIGGGGGGVLGSKTLMQSMRSICKYVIKCILL